MRNIKWLTVFFLVVSSICFQLWKFHAYRLPHSQVIVELKKHETLGSLKNQLYKNGLISNKQFFWFLVKFQYNYRNFQAGKYRFHSPLAPVDLISAMLKGETFQSLNFSITIPEGFSLRQVGARLHEYGYPALSLSNTKRILKKWKIEASSLEGYLYPATYKFYDKRPSTFFIYESMVSEFFKRIPQTYVEDLSKRSIDLHQAVIIASMIEKETGRDDERTLISEGKALAIDATLIYGIKDYQGDLKNHHLKDRSNLYNTRIHRGYPPGPICSPSLASLLAVLNPSSYGHLFYVTMPGDMEKRHHFSKSLVEHNRYVKKLVDYGKKNK